MLRANQMPTRDKRPVRAPKPSSRTKQQAAIDAGRTMAALLGAPLLAFTIGVWLIAFLPFADESSYAIGLHTMVPVWIVLTCTVPLARSARSAWAYCLLPSLALGLMLFIKAS